jgi:hypothetical protein
VLAACSNPALWASDRIVLRNTKVIAGRKVASFDADGVRLEGAASPQFLGWDEIESGTLAQGQDQFNQLLKDLGTPLFRIRRQLTDGRYEEILPHAQAVFPHYLNRRSPTAYLVSQGLMWSLLAHNQRESAVAPYLICLDILQAKENKKLVPPGTRRLPFDPNSGLSAELAPVWFDPAAARAALPDARKVLGGMSKPLPPAAPFYVATLAVTAGDPAAADAVLKDVQLNNRTARELNDILAAQREVLMGKPAAAVAALEKQVDQLLEANRPAAWYWLGMAALAGREERKEKEGVVRLLRLPALYGDQAPDLAGAGLYHSAAALQKLNDTQGSIGLRRELLGRFAQTYHGARLKAELDAGKEAEKPVGEK